jgi:O-antigen ligase
MNTAISNIPKAYLFRSKWANNFALWSVTTMAFCINFGVALVSIASLLTIVAALLIFITKQHKSIANDLVHRPTSTIYIIPVALLWMGITGLWTQSSLQDSAVQLMRYSRILTIPIIYFLIRTQDQSIKVLKVWVYGQLFVIASSCLLWLGFTLPWASNSHASLDLTPFTSTLEQPIMNTIMFIVVWHLREHFIGLWGKKAVYILLAFTVFEVFFIMEGRTGYLCMLLTLTFIAWRSISPKLRVFVVFFPILLFSLVYTTSSKFERRVDEVFADVKNYTQGSKVSSQGNRIDFTIRSLEAIEERPLLGYGLGSWPLAYRHVRGGHAPTEIINGITKELKADNPHEQFLLWFVEGGLVAFSLLLGIYYSIYKDSKRLITPAKQALQLILAMITFASLLNCPFHGAGMSEFLCFSIAILLNFVRSNEPKVSNI